MGFGVAKQHKIYSKCSCYLSCLVLLMQSRVHGDALDAVHTAVCFPLGLQLQPLMLFHLGNRNCKLLDVTPSKPPLLNHFSFMFDLV